MRLCVRKIRLVSLAAAVLAAVFVAGIGWNNAYATPPPLANLFSGGFELTDHNGKSRSSNDFRGRFMMIFFGYTYCPTICPTNLQHMAQALDLLGKKADKVQPLFITIDPGRDTPEVLKDYVANFGTKILGLTGSEAQIRGVARSYRVHRRKVVPDGSDPEDYLVDHSSLTLLIGPDGKFRTLFPHDTTGQVMAKRMEKYLLKD